jgi:cytochrome oxidase assembly protein ShyY1
MRLRLPRPRLTLRVLLLLVAVIAAALGWQLKRQRDLKRAIESIEAKGGMIFHSDQLRNNPTTTTEPSWFRQLMGETAFDDVG